MTTIPNGPKPNKGKTPDPLPAFERLIRAAYMAGVSDYKRATDGFDAPSAAHRYVGDIEGSIRLAILAAKSCGVV